MKSQYVDSAAMMVHPLCPPLMLGVKQRVRAKAEHAFSHCLNLAISHSCH